MKNFAIIINFEEKRALYEEIRKKDYPNLDALPLTYDWEMLRYNCWDDQKMIRNFGKTTDVCETLIRIIIKDNRIVGVTLKSALGGQPTLLRSAQKHQIFQSNIALRICRSTDQKWRFFATIAKRGFSGIVRQGGSTHQGV